jgi:hypothetical protein
MKLSEAITKLHANTDTYLFGIDIKDISTSEFADLASAIQQNTSASFLSFSDRNLNAEAAQVITEALRQNTTVQEIVGIELSDISELLVRNRYFAAKKQLEDICYANDHLGQTCRKLYPESAHAFRETGLRIIAHIERLKADDPTKIAIFTKALNKLSDLVQYKENIVNIDEFLVDLKTNIDSDDYKQLRARICVLVGLCIMFASIVAITFSVITGSALLIPAAAIGLSCVAPMLGAAAMIIDEAGINKAGANGQLKHYFFTSTTPEREDDRQVLDILEPFASPT